MALLSILFKLFIFRSKSQESRVSLSILTQLKRSQNLKRRTRRPETLLTTLRRARESVLKAAWPAPPPCRGRGQGRTWWRWRCCGPSRGRCLEPIMGRGRGGRGGHLGEDWGHQGPASVNREWRWSQTRLLFVLTNQSRAPSQELNKIMAQRLKHYQLKLMLRLNLRQTLRLRILQNCNWTTPLNL